MKRCNEKINSQLNLERKERDDIDEEVAFIGNECMNFMEENVDYFIEKGNAFIEGKYPSEWFSFEEIKVFIKENFMSAESSDEIEVDSILEEINKLDPESLDYYQCSWEWREAGIEDLIKSYYDLPEETYNIE